jgi:hypothetical protein
MRLIGFFSSGIVSCALASVACLAFAGCAGASDDESLAQGDSHLTSSMSGNQLKATAVAQLIRQAGFPEAVVSKMVCTAYYESRFYDHTINHDSNGTSDHGLLQVNSIHIHDKGCPSTTDGLYDPTANTKCAFLIYKADVARGHDGITAPWAAYRAHKSECDKPAAASSPWNFGGASPGPTGVPTPGVPTPGVKPCANPNPLLTPAADQIACNGDADSCGFDTGHACTDPADCCSNACADNGTGQTVCGGAATTAAAATTGGTCNRNGAFYCGNPASKLKGDPNSLYQCESGRMIFSQACTAGCNISAQGVDDFCSPDPNTGVTSTIGGTPNFGTDTGFQTDPGGGFCAPANGVCLGPGDTCCADAFGIPQTCVQDPVDETVFLCSSF